MSGARITQRHVASDEDVAYAEGRGLLVSILCPCDALFLCAPLRHTLVCVACLFVSLFAEATRSALHVPFQVPLDEVDNPAVLGQQPASGDDYL